MAETNQRSALSAVPLVLTALGSGSVGFFGHQAIYDPRKPADVEQRVILLERRVIEMEHRRADQRLEDLLREVLSRLDRMPVNEAN